MCGIWLLCGMDSQQSLHCNDAFARIAHRGPDAWRLEMDARMHNVFVGFHRLSIVDGLYGMQPMKLHRYPHITLLCNGEIYNFKSLGKELNFPYETNCDVECIIHLYATEGIEKVVRSLDGVYSFIIIDSEKKQVHVARDPYGVRPAFVLRTDNGVLGVCSEAKGLMPMAAELNGAGFKVIQFPPGTYESYSVGPDGRTSLLSAVRFYDIGVTKPTFKTSVAWKDLETGDMKTNIANLLTAAVKKRLMADRRIGCLLSGGLDSSLIAALLVKLAREANIPYKVQSFSVGMGTSPDIVAARQVAQHIGSEHHEIIFTEEDVGSVLDQVIYSLETPDITTIRASIGMQLIARFIKSTSDSTVIFSGEGADEVAQGYIYLRDAPSVEAGHEESIRLLKDIHLYDGLRADRTTAAHCLELRLPFLDQQFSSYFLSLPADLRRPVNGVEKHLLRSAFAGTDLIPDNILWRHKEAFSDGVASIRKSLFQVLQEAIDSRIPDCEVAGLSAKFSHVPPYTKESLYYRIQFEKNFPKMCKHLMPYYWMPRWTDVKDPSARFIKHYAADKDEGDQAVA